MKKRAAVKPNYDVDTYKKRGSYTALGYRAVAIATKDGRFPQNYSGEYLQTYDRIKLIAQSRDFHRNNAIYCGMIERAVAYIIGTGFNLQATGKNREAVENLWSEAWKRPEIRGIQSGAMLEKQMARELLLCGDASAIKLSNGQLQTIEAEQIQSSTNPSGIDISDYGTPTNFTVCPYKNGTVSTREGKSVSPENMLFITTADRPSAIRGVPPCQSAFPMIHRINDVCDSEAIAWQTVSRMALAITQEGGALAAYNQSTADPDAQTGTLTPRITDLDYALIFHGNPGDKVEGIARNVPGQSFPESIRTFLRLLGLPIGLPLELILLDWTQGNYSQSRAVLEQAYQTFLGWQMLLKDFFYKPVFEWMVKRWEASGSLPLSSDNLSHEWIAPSFPWIDQLKEAQAYGLKVDRGFDTYSSVCKTLNKDMQEVRAARVREVRDAIAEAKSIESETSVLVPWEYFAGMLPTTASTKIATQSDTQNGAANEQPV